MTYIIHGQPHVIVCAENHQDVFLWYNIYVIERHICLVISIITEQVKIKNEVKYGL